MILLQEPTRIQLVGYDSRRSQLQTSLRYKDQRAEYDYMRLKKNHKAVYSMGQEAYDEELDRLKGMINQCLLTTDETGALSTLSGLAGWLSEKYGDQIEVGYEYPEPKLIPWAEKPTREMRPYQVEALDALLQAKHGAVEIGTGLGKSFIILNLVKKLGLQTVVMAPSQSIANQLLEEFRLAFGKKYVGQFYDGKKDLNKLITVAVCNSLALVEKNSPAWKWLSGTKVFVADESHMVAADTLASICLNLLAQAPYRFFFSGTQTRADGLELLLNGVIGKVVYSMTVRQGVDQGWLARPLFRRVVVDSNMKYRGPDPRKLTQEHLYRNPEVYAQVGRLVNQCVKTLNRPVVVLIKEVEQFGLLLPHLRHDVKFAHGGVTKDNSKKVPAAYHESDPTQLVKDFNDHKFPILVGTSCIATGTDIRVVGAIFNLQGGTSIIAHSQAVGRGTRGGTKNEVFYKDGVKKLDCYYFDVDVDDDLYGDKEFRDLLLTHRHALERKKIFEGIYGPVETIDLRRKL